MTYFEYQYSDYSLIYSKKKYFHLFDIKKLYYVGTPNKRTRYYLNFQNFDIFFFFF